MLFTLLKIIHTLALAFWSGAVVFFAFFVALPTIDSMKQLAQRTGNWLGLSTELQGTRLAGEFLDVVFNRYFPFQCICGLAALVTALFWWSIPGWISKIRVLVIALALAGAVANQFVLAVRVHELRSQRYSTDASLAEKASAAFGPAHTASLLVDLAGVALVIVALIMILWLPNEKPPT